MLAHAHTQEVINLYLISYGLLWLPGKQMTSPFASAGDCEQNSHAPSFGQQEQQPQQEHEGLLPGPSNTGHLLHMLCPGICRIANQGTFASSIAKPKARAA